MKATVVGGSISGLLVGHFLLRLGWDVQVYESTSSTLAGRGAGITTQQGLFDVLDKLGISNGESLGVHITTRKTFSLDGVELGSREMPQVVTSWSRLYRLLLSTFPAERYHQGQLFTGYRESADGVTVNFNESDSVQADILVGADGIRSALRTLLEPDVQPVYAGYVAWRGLVPESALSASERAKVFPFFSFCLPPGEQSLAYPVAGEDHALTQGKRRCNIVWYRPADAVVELPRLLTDVNGNNSGDSIAPQLIRDDVIAELRQAAASSLSPQHAALIEKVEHPFLQPIFDLHMSRMVHGRVVLVGDAAFVARPHLGMGVTKAAADASALAGCLEEHDDLDVALDAFNQRRHSANMAIVERSRQLGAYMQASRHTPEERAFAEKHRSVDAVMRETASDNW